MVRGWTVWSGLVRDRSGGHRLVRDWSRIGQGSVSTCWRSRPPSLLAAAGPPTSLAAAELPTSLAGPLLISVENFVAFCKMQLDLMQPNAVDVNSFLPCGHDVHVVRPPEHPCAGGNTSLVTARRRCRTRHWIICWRRQSPPLRWRLGQIDHLRRGREFLVRRTLSWSCTESLSRG